MLGGSKVGIAALSVIVMAASSMAAAAAAPQDPSDRDLEPAAVVDDSPVMLSDGELRQAVESLGSGESVTGDVEVVGGEEIVVEVVHDEGVSIDDLVGSLGGTIRDSAFGLTLAAVPYDRLEELEADPAVELVRRPLRVDLVPADVESSTGGADATQAVVGEHVAKTKAGAWHAAGFKGQGVKVGVIDFFGASVWNAAQAAGEVPAPSGTFCRSAGNACTLFGSDASHGVGVAEVVHDMAPDADLYLVSATTPTDLNAAVDYLIAQDVDIITRSLAAEYDGPGDGTGFLANVQAKAVAAGIVWFNSAGNHGGTGTPNGVISPNDGGHWRGTWSDADADGWQEFLPSNEIMQVSCSYMQGLRWDDWPAAAPTDYDVHVWTAPDFTQPPAFIGDDRQSLGADPVERLLNVPCSQGTTVYLAVKLVSSGNGTAGDILQIAVNSARLDPWTNAYSATQPFADTKSAGGLAIGAVDPAFGGTIANYSSRGPTNDGRIKPDISAASCLKTFTYGTGCFDGTSAATPVAAGAAALVKSAGAATTPAAIKTYLLTKAFVDRGAAGKDNTFGVGELVLPAPAGGGDAVKPKWPETALTADGIGERALTLHWKAATDNVGVKSYLVYQAPGTPVNGFYQGKLVATLGAGARSRTVTGLLPETTYAFWVEAADAAGNASVDGPLALFSTATDFVDTNASIFHDDIAWLSVTGITKGCNPPVNDSYCPDSPVLRSQMASFIVRALGLTGGEGSDYFVDDDGEVAETDIDRLAFWEITLGCAPDGGEPRFCPGNPVTRQQMASFLSRALLLSAGWDVDAFIDDDFSVHEFDINRLAYANITSGCNPPSNNRYCPTNSVTRGQMAAFMKRSAPLINKVRDILGIPRLPLGLEDVAVEGSPPLGAKAIVETTND